MSSLLNPDGAGVFTMVGRGSGAGGAQRSGVKVRSLCEESHVGWKESRGGGNQSEVRLECADSPRNQSGLATLRLCTTADGVEDCGVMEFVIIGEQRGRLVKHCKSECRFEHQLGLNGKMQELGVQEKGYPRPNR